ncbi:MAG: hypothetical protein QMD92_07905 [bacterium]|nr:hypothetical protein [bacterium]
MELPPEYKQRIIEKSFLGKRITFEKFIKFIFFLFIFAAFAFFFYSNFMYYKETKSLVGPKEKHQARKELGIEQKIETK